jgi:hypothetical protein
MLECVRTIRLVKKSDPKPPENVESTLDVLKLLQDGMEAVLKRVRLKKLRAGRTLEQQPRSASADEILKHRRKRRAKIDFACAVLGLQVSLDDSAFCFLLNVKRTEVWRDMLADFKPKCLSSAERPQPASRV